MRVWLPYLVEGRRGGTHAFAALDVLDHELVRLVCGVHSRLRTLYGEGERVDDYEGLADDLALHDAHDLVWYT